MSWPTSFNPDLFERVRRLEIAARHAVDGMLSGRHRSPHKGSSLEFAEHREYAPGDDLKHLDWKIFAKTDRFYVKQYEEETTLQVLFVLDACESMGYPAGSTCKLRYAAAAVGALASAVLSAHDAVGLCVIGDTVRAHLAPSIHGHHLVSLCRALDETQAHGAAAMWRELPGVVQRLRGKGLVIVLSDALDEAPDILPALQAARERHEVLLWQVNTPDEAHFPFDEYMRFEALSGLDRLTLDARAVAGRYRAFFAEHARALQRGVWGMGGDYLACTTDQPIDATLRRLATLHRA